MAFQPNADCTVKLKVRMANDSRTFYLLNKDKSTTSNPVSSFSPAAKDTWYETWEVELTAGTWYALIGSGSNFYIASMQFTAASHTVTYNANGGTGDAMSNSTGASITLKANTYTAPSGYAFYRWNTAANCSGTDYAAGATVTSNLNLYAKWSQTVTLDANTANHGSGENGSAKAFYNGTSLSDISHTSAASGYALNGYYTEATGGTKILNANGTFAETTISGYITEGAWTKTGATTLYAQYVAAAKYSVTHTLSHVTASSGETGTNAATQGVAYSATFSADSKYSLPSSIAVTIGGTPATEGTEYTWSEGTVTIGGNYVTGAIVISITGSHNVCTTPTITAESAFNFEHKGYAVTITNNEEGSTLKYSTDGGSSWSDYSSTLYATTTTTFKAKSVKDNYDDSEVASKKVTNIFDGEKKYIAWVYTKGYNSGSGKPGYTFASDPMVVELKKAYNVVEVDYAEGTSPSNDLKNADLIVCTEAMSGNKTMSNGMVNLLNNDGKGTPMIGLKVYNYGNGDDATKRWKWGLPSNPSSTTLGFTPNSKLYKVLNGVTFESDGTIKLAFSSYDTGSYKNVVQSANFTGANKPTDNAILGRIGSDDTKVVMHYSALKKYFGLGLSSDCWATYTPSAVAIIKNAAAMLIAGESLTTEVSNVSGTITACGYNTFSSSYPLDLSTLTDGMKAYVVSSITDSKAVLTRSTAKVPSGTGLMIKGDAGDDFTINTTSEATTTPAANLLIGAPSGTTVTAANNTSEWNYVFGWTDPAAPGFYLIDAVSANLSTGKAYLHTTNALSVVSGEGAPSLIRIIDEENNATDINTIDANVEAVKFFENGQLLIQKNGVVYDAIGRIIRK